MIYFLVQLRGEGSGAQHENSRRTASAKNVASQRVMFKDDLLSINNIKILK
jgi:hypothetical protein